jgi:hypothetical protein
MRVEGSCHCGAVRFEAEADPDGVSVCHCTDCQALTGTAFRTSVRAVDGTLRVTQGTPRVYTKQADNGRGREQHFCGDCGSPLLTREAGQAEGWHLRWGALRERDALIPASAIWLRSAVPWLGLVPDLPGRDGD